VLFFLPFVVQAGPPTIADAVTPGCNGVVPIVTVTLDALTAGTYYANLYYYFNPNVTSPPPPVMLSGLFNPAVVPIPLGFIADDRHILWISIYLGNALHLRMEPGRPTIRSSCRTVEKD
jgi:hypothetical protein